MFVIETSNPEIRGGQWFRIWSSDLPNAMDACEYLKAAVVNEWRSGVQYRMRYIMKKEDVPA